MCDSDDCSPIRLMRELAEPGASWGCARSSGQDGTSRVPSVSSVSEVRKSPARHAQYLPGARRPRPPGEGLQPQQALCPRGDGNLCWKGGGCVSVPPGPSGGRAAVPEPCLTGAAPVWGRRWGTVAGACPGQTDRPRFKEGLCSWPTGGPGGRSPAVAQTRLSNGKDHLL